MQNGRYRARIQIVLFPENLKDAWDPAELVLEYCPIAIMIASCRTFGTREGGRDAEPNTVAQPK